MIKNNLSIEFEIIDSDLLEIKINRKNKVKQYTWALLYCAIVFNIVVFLGLFIIINIVFSILIYNLIILAIMGFQILYNTSYERIFRFQLIENIVIKKKFVFGRLTSKKYDLSNMHHVECKFDAIAGTYRYNLNLILKNEVKIKIYDTNDEHLASDHAGQLSKFLGIKCSYPIAGSKKQWRMNNQVK